MALGDVRDYFKRAYASLLVPVPDDDSGVRLGADSHEEFLGFIVAEVC